MPKIPSRPALDLSGKWAVELPSLPDEDLAQTPDPHVLIRHEDFYRFAATYRFGTQRGEIDGRVDEVWPNAAQLFLTFVGLNDGRRSSVRPATLATTPRARRSSTARSAIIAATTCPS